ncbi:hypothetical protein AQV86_01030 [Nanohaloarchaea archaeon SG9]|nr:hypothetical protein AQV86_01030 [Nanohaloarchaea archaeon SG9]
MSDNFELQSVVEEDGSPERILYGEPGHLPEVDESERRGYLFEIGEHSPSERARLTVDASAVIFDDVYSVMEEDSFEEFMSGRAVSRGMYGEEFDAKEVAEDLVREIERYGLEDGASPPEGYEVTVSNPE